MNDWQQIAAGGGAGFMTSLVTLVFTLLGFQRRLERLEREKLNKELHDLCSTGVLHQINEIRRQMMQEIRQLRLDTSADIRALAERVDRMVETRKPAAGK